MVLHLMHSFYTVSKINFYINAPYFVVYYFYMT